MKNLIFSNGFTQESSFITEHLKLQCFYPRFHRHEESLLVWIKEGDGRLILEKNEIAFYPNDIFFIDAGVSHFFKYSAKYLEKSNHKASDVFTLYLNPKGALSGLLQLPEMKIHNLETYEREPQAIKIPAAYKETIQYRLMELERLSDIQRIMGLVSLLSDLRQIRELTILSINRNQVTYKMSIKFHAILNFIKEHYSDRITLQEVADMIPMTRNSFCRYFKECTGQSFIEFLNEYRIGEACKVLRQNGDVVIKDVAYNTGFNSVTNFNRIFRKVTGISPSDFKANSKFGSLD